MSKQVKKNNHQVTRALLSQWSGDRQGRSVIHYFDITCQKKSFSQGRSASFAIVPYLYVPLHEDGSRNDDLENEFSVDESSLGLLIKSSLPNGAPIQKTSLQKRAIRSCVSLGYRSAYYVARMLMVASGGGINPSERHKASIETMKRSLKNRYSHFENWKFVVVKNLTSDLLINEQPFRDWTIHKNPQQFITMPITPRSMLYGIPSPTGQFSLEWKDHVHEKVNVENHNLFAVQTARYFVVARTEMQLDTVIPLLSEELVKSRMATDRVVGMQSTPVAPAESK